VYWIYSFFLLIALLFAFPGYALKLRFRRGEKLHLAERLALRRLVRPAGRPLLWIHAVSVGEVLSLQSPVREIKSRHPDWAVAFSVLTGTGQKMALAKMADADLIFFIPLDFGWCVRRVFRGLKPDLMILAESEFWPRLLREARRRSVPVLLINGRISARTAKRMRRLRPLVRAVFKSVTRFLVQTERDKERLTEAGLQADRIAVAGNLKCEVCLPALSSEEVARFRVDIGIPASRKVLLAGSIHPGEEGPLLRAFGAAKAAGRPVRLILAPRHPEKFADLGKSPEGAGLLFQRKTELRPDSAWDVLVLDTIGELARFYALADAAFIGGSLIKWGGQNLLEPAFYGKPVFFGPHMDNFAALAEAFVLDGGARVVHTPADLEAMFDLEDTAALDDMGRRAHRTLESLSGATGKTLAVIEELMPYEFPQG
jgi:3-deoxy-D-manno-octulosonic-acid transferase